jgi:hypothetical protein
MSFMTGPSYAESPAVEISDFKNGSMSVMDAFGESSEFVAAALRRK